MSSHAYAYTHTHTHRRQKLQESLCYRQFSVGVDEEEAWLNEKTTLVSSEEVGDTLAAVQVGVVTWVMGAAWGRLVIYSGDFLVEFNHLRYTLYLP